MVMLRLDDLDYLPDTTRAKLDEWESQLRELEEQAPKRPQGILRLGTGEFVTGDFLPPSSVGRLWLFSVMIDLVPQVFDDAVERAVRIVAAHGDFMAYAAEQCAAHFRGSVDTQPSRNPRRQAERERRLVRRAYAWQSKFYDRHGQDVIAAMGKEYIPWMERWRIGNDLHPECSLLMMGLSLDVARCRVSRLVPPRWYVTVRMLQLAAPLADIGLAVPLPAPTKFVGKLPAWNHAAESKDAYLARARDRVDQLLLAHVKTVEGESLRQGRDRVPSKRNGDEHFRWLVRYQFLCESQAVIARHACVERQTVQSAIHATAELVGLPLRGALPAGRRRRGPSDSTISRSRKAA